jgi:uncharacterized protein (DUF58 family)
MLTTRGWWFLAISTLVLLLGVLSLNLTLAVLGLTLVLWFFGQALLFVFRTRLLGRHLLVERELRDERGRVDNLWAGRTFEVRVTVRLESVLTLPHVAIADWVPLGVEHADGERRGDGILTAETPLELAYRIRCPAVGRVRFEGVRIHLADLQGFFFHGTFLPALVSLRVLPVLTDAEGQAATAKRHNLLPPPGVHRLRRPGSGSELLDLRDYLPGDPPKTIAWKVSARRDRLITRVYESEVPLRCTLFVDTSHSVRLGPAGNNALARLIGIATAAAQANTAGRDLTGLGLVDEQFASMIRPARTPRHLVQLLQKLADVANLAPATGKAPVNTLLPLAHAFAEEVYPYLLRPEVNRVPFWLPWLWPLPAAGQRVTAAGFVGNRLFWLLAFIPFAALVLLTGYGIDLAYRSSPWPVLVPGLLLFLAQVVGMGLIYWWLMRGVRSALSMLFAPGTRRLARWRKQLAAILSARYGLAPGGLAALLEDDERCSLLLQRFLAEHDVPYPLPFYDEQGRYLFSSPGKVEVLAGALAAAVGKGHDNELFVLLVDLLELDEYLGPLLRSVRVALSRHHQVMLVCPWPPGVPLPPRSFEPLPHPSARAAGINPAARAALLPALEEAAAERFHAAFRRLRQTFARLGVPVVCAAEGEAVRLILDRLERMRMLGRRR